MTSAISVTGAALIPTSSQTVGPFVEIGCKYLGTDRVAAPGPGMLDVTVRGRVLDGDGEQVPDYMLEIWQSVIPTAGKALDGQRSFRRFATQDDHPGRRATAVAFARVMPLADGSFAFHTAYDPSHGAAHLAMLVFMRGLLKPLHTRIYFPGDARNDTDPVLALVPPDRRATLVANRDSRVDGSHEFEWNIVLQGANETVFFEW